MAEVDDLARRQRWRLVLGKDAESSLGCGCHGQAAQRDEALEFLYGRENEGRNVRREDDSERGGGDEDSLLTVPEWLSQVHELFPKSTIERLERDALERYELEAMVNDADVLRRCQPNMTLLKAVLHTKHLMKPEVLAEARRLIARVVRQLMEKLTRPMHSPFFGALDPRRRSLHKIARNFDAKETIRRNLGRWQPEQQRLYIEKPYFLSRVRRHMDRWRLVILVDQSGSMANSIIHAAVTAAIFWQMRQLNTHLVLFDTSIVDVTAHCQDPVETLLGVQLGGGTDIGQALTYAETLISEPRRTLVILISDFYEGCSERALLKAAKRLVESGAQLLGLATLDELCRPSYDVRLASALVRLGAEVGAMTPGELAQWVAEKVR